jgi:ankyrin repeat protein
VEARFYPAIAAIKADDVDRLGSLIHADPTLATSRSTMSHPTLLQCLVLEGKNAAHHVDMARLLIDAGAELNGPLCACASCDNVAVASLLLDRGAAVDGSGGWSPLEEALYWNSPGVVRLLVQRGVSIHNLRSAAGLGRTDVMASFFAADGGLLAEAGTINWPWGDRSDIERSNLDRRTKDMLIATFTSFSSDRQSIIDNALVYACMHGHIDAARLLFERGAQVNAIPPGFDYAGTALHYAALNGQQATVQFLIGRGADVTIEDTKVGQTAAGWADHGGHPVLGDLLRRPASS